MRTTILTLVLSVLLGSVAWSGDDIVSLEEAERLSHERHVFMEELGKSMRTIKGFLSGRNDAAEALAATGVLKDAASAIPPLFPPGTRPGCPAPNRRSRCHLGKLVGLRDGRTASGRAGSHARDGADFGR